MTKQQAYIEMSDLCEQMQALYRQCVNLANEAQIQFELPWGGEGCTSEEGYGAGATYYPAGVDHWNKCDVDNAQWVSSSQSC